MSPLVSESLSQHSEAMIIQPARFFLICQWTSYAGGGLETLDQILPGGMQFTDPIALKANELAQGSVFATTGRSSRSTVSSATTPCVHCTATPTARPCPRRRHAPCSPGKGGQASCGASQRSRCGSRGSHELRGGRKRGQETAQSLG